MAAPRLLHLIVGAVILLSAGSIGAQSDPDSAQHHEVIADSGQATVESAIENSPASSVTTAVELDAIRMEIIQARRFMVVLGGCWLAWASLSLLFRWI